MAIHLSKTGGYNKRRLLVQTHIAQAAMLVAVD
jgi:hypothetical protein